MSESSSKESDIPSFSYNGSWVEYHSRVVDTACHARQIKPGLIPSRAGFLTAALPEFSWQRTSIDLQSALTLLLSRMDKMESNIANFTKTNTFFMKESLPRSRIRFLFTLIHQSIKEMILMRKLGPRLRSYVPLIIRRFSPIQIPKCSFLLKINAPKSSCGAIFDKETTGGHFALDESLLHSFRTESSFVWT